MTADEIITGVLQREGGFVNNRFDAGGPTNSGITLATLRRWRVGQIVTVEDLQALPESEKRAIYRHEYIDAPGFDQIADVSLQAQLVDFGVVSSPARAIRWLQRTIGTPVTGVLDDQMLAALYQLPPRMVNNALVAARLYMGYRIVASDPTQRVFEEGWEHRALSFFIADS